MSRFEKLINMDPEDEMIFDEELDMDPVYSEDGDEVVCDLCGHVMKWNGNYICPWCSRVMDRPTFFNHIGAEQMLDKCVGCEANYPYCRDICSDYYKEYGFTD